VDSAIDPGTSVARRTWRRISFWCPLDVASLWESALRSCRVAAGPRVEDWECFLLLVQALRDTWENQEDPHWLRRYRTLERDNWRCKAPGCTSRSGLNEHHIQFRSQQGGNETENLVTLCVGHHQLGLHAGGLRCFGRAPDALWWDLGVRAGGKPLIRYFGDRIVARRPLVTSAGVPGQARPQSARPPDAQSGHALVLIELCKLSAPRGIPAADAASRAPVH